MEIEFKKWIDNLPESYIFMYSEFMKFEGEVLEFMYLYNVKYNELKHILFTAILIKNNKQNLN